ncbi:DUF2484 family protein [Loktanella sp. IMCC34160]|uniref:DUF2484 family protein n=1 Tax=Loktanella sp. IMCC34160 TaxID=2510646 RepID=UPI00101B698D|nr:DUF2484 family protein [Loktanella sp. IMCC34160]RYG90861.1 DUF2484 family protein [Loktanella sp. IMCC34160]
MSYSLIAAAFWVILGTITALLPLRRQMWPGLTLLVLAPVILVWLSVDHGLWIGALGAAGFVSMFRNPLRYLWARVRGRNPQLPPELRR